MLKEEEKKIRAGGAEVKTMENRVLAVADPMAEILCDELIPSI